MKRYATVSAAKAHVEARIVETIEAAMRSGGRDIETPGRFTALLEAFSACEIALDYISDELDAAELERQSHGEQ